MLSFLKSEILMGFKYGLHLCTHSLIITCTARWPLRCNWGDHRLIELTLLFSQCTWKSLLHWISKKWSCLIASLMHCHPNIYIYRTWIRVWIVVKGNMSKRLHDREFLFNELYKDSWYQATSAWQTAKSDVKSCLPHTESSGLGR